jgi:hypothetical protein
VKEAIDRAYAELAREDRIQAVRRIADSGVEDLPDPEQLSREPENAHEPGGVH